MVGNDVACSQGPSKSVEDGTLANTDLGVDDDEWKLQVCCELDGRDQVSRSAWG